MPERRRTWQVDWASALLLLIALICGALFWWGTGHSGDLLAFAPSVVAATLAAEHLVQRRAP